MITCPTCGAQNDPANRFCDQCGTRLDAAANTPTPAAGTPTAVDAASQPTATATTCPSCGATVLPGEAFCDSCGAALPATATAAPATASNDAPTMLASPSAEAAPATSGGDTTVCPVCGHHNMPGDRFCDNCGADLQAPAPTQAASSSEATVVATPDPASALSVPTSGDDPPALPPTSADEATQVPISVESAQVPTEAAPPSVDATPVASAEETAPAPATVPEASPVVPAPATSSDEKTTLPAGTAVTPSAPDTSAERARLEEVIATQQRVIAQLEQTQSALGAATPAAILQTLQDARNTLSQAESDLQMLPTAKPAADPAEVARLEEAVATQQKVVDQLEQTQTALGAATPEAIKQALQSARDALTQAQSELQTLTGAAPATSTATSGVPSADATVSAPATQAPAPAESQPTSPPVTTPPTPAPAPAGPRLVMVEGNKELTLPTDKAEIIIGREDPISQIFPEVDLTPFGGESGGVSRQHARLNHQNGQWTITDLNSTNYTRVEGTKIDPNTPVAIQDGTRLQFGRIATVFHM